MVCRSCGTVADVNCAVGAAPCLTASDDHGFVVDEAEVIYGALYVQQRAIAVLGALPLLIAFVLFQRQIVQSIANTGLKG